MMEKSKPAVKPDRGYGVKSNWWLWVSKLPVTKGPTDGASKSISKTQNEEKETAGKIKPGDLKTAFDSWSQILKRSVGKKETSSDTTQTVSQEQHQDGETQARQILIDNPKISAATMLNTMKAQGLEVVKKETDAASSNAQALRSEENNKTIKIQARFLEKGAKNDAVGWTRFRCVLLQEGLGNLRDGFYYSREALESALPIFDGKKIYADHPTLVDEETRPERSVKDILGHFENLELTTDSKTGQSQIEADVVILPDEPYRWARALLRHAVEFSQSYPDKEFVGLSINAFGDADDAKPIESILESVPEGAKPKIIKAKEEGLTEIKVVTKFEDAVSCDLVTEAGAGGKVLKLIEQEKEMGTKKKTQAKESETEKKESHPAGAAEADGAPGDKAPASGHDDEQQDIALFKKMISKYMDGGEEEGQEEALEMAKEAFDGYKEMGYQEDEALKCAAAAVKLAKHMASKKSKETEEEKPEEKPEQKQEETKQAEAKQSEEESEKKESETEKKESKVVELTGKIALLESQVKTFQMRDHLEKVLRESGLPMATTKKFKELTSVKEAKSEKEIDKLFSIFKEGFGTIGSEANDGYDFAIMTEKTTSKGTSIKGIDLGDCVN